LVVLSFLPLGYNPRSFYIATGRRLVVSL